MPDKRPKKMKHTKKGRYIKNRKYGVYKGSWDRGSSKESILQEERQKLGRDAYVFCTDRERNKCKP